MDGGVNLFVKNTRIKRVHDLVESTLHGDAHFLFNDRLYALSRDISLQSFFDHSFMNTLLFGRVNINIFEPTVRGGSVFLKRSPECIEEMENH